MPILVFPGLSVLDLGPMYATDRRKTDTRQTDRRQTASSLNAPARGDGHNKAIYFLIAVHGVFRSESAHVRHRESVFMVI